jgi:RpiB/LacA/LacB family sugar-phosphate isomerase
LKETIVCELERQHQVVDKGTVSEAAGRLSRFRRSGRLASSASAERGIVLCGSGVGASVAANKIPGIRAAVCHDTYSAHQGVEHDDMNVLTLGARIIGPELAIELVRAFGPRFSGERRAPPTR